MTAAYRPEIDGLRAVAVIPVVLFHMGAPWMPGGFLGVDVFFVISGFLITSIVVGEHEHGTFEYSRFWLRRIRRIFPALVVMLMATSIASVFIAGTDNHRLGQLGIAALLSFANVSVWHLTGSYWGTEAESLPLLHTWTLSVEEQFYLVFPLFIGLLFRFARNWVFAGLMTATLASFALYLFGAERHPAATFFLLPTRAWELGAGGLLAIVQSKYSKTPSGNAFLACVGLAAIAFSYLFLPGDEILPGSLALVVAGSTLVIAFATDRQGLANRLLSARPMVAIGKMSYSIYLWHWPILVLARNYHNSGGQELSTSILAGMIGSASVASYYLVEKTTRRREKIIGPAATAFALSLALSCFLILQEPPFDGSVYSPVVWRGREYDVNPTQRTWEGAMKEKMESIAVTPREARFQDAYKTNGVLKTYGPSGVDIVVLGDSHALMWANVLDEIAQHLGLTISFFTADGTSPFIKLPLEKHHSPYWNADDRLLFDETRLKRIKEWKPKLVLLLTAWSRKRDEQMDDLFRFLQESDCQVLTIEQPPELFFGDRNTPRQLAIMKIAPKEGLNQYVHMKSRKKRDDGRRVIAELERKYSFFHSIRISDLFIRDEAKVWVLEGNHVLYIDDDHLSQDGALKAKGRIEGAVKALLEKRGKT